MFLQAITIWHNQAKTELKRNRGVARSAAASDDWYSRNFNRQLGQVTVGVDDGLVGLVRQVDVDSIQEKLGTSFSVRDDPTANFLNIVNTSNSHIDDELRWTEEPLNIVDISVTPNSNHELTTWRQTQNVLFCIQFKIQLTKPLSRDSTSEKSTWPDR